MISNEVQHLGYRVKRLTDLIVPASWGCAACCLLHFGLLLKQNKQFKGSIFLSISQSTENVLANILLLDYLINVVI